MQRRTIRSRGAEPSPADIIIAGGGPAGLSLAASLATRGVDVRVVAADEPRRWTQNFAIWEDEARAAGVHPTLRARWPFVTVRIDDERSHRLHRGYGAVDNERLADHLLQPLPAKALRRDRVTHVSHGRDGARVRLAGGDELRARTFVDATGHGAFVRRRGRTRPAAQVAFGQLLSGADLSAFGEGALLMDFRAPSPRPEPTFLYALPLPDGKLFVEETSLVSSPPMSVETARRRLAHRLEAMGVRGRVVAEERCFIPMGAPLPARSQRTLAFGAAASMTHPATGYQLAGALLAAPQVAESLARALDDGVSPAEVSRRGWRSIWPTHHRRARRLQIFGMDVVASLDGRRQREFFDAFFRASGERWGELMSFAGDGAALADVMSETFRVLPADLRGHATRLLLRRHPTLVPHLGRALVTRLVG
jgi:lycopene beta-cyclase